MTTMPPIVGAPRPALMQEYVQNMVTHLCTLHPGVKPEYIEKFVRDTCRAQMQRPQATIIAHPSYGNSELRTVDLYKHIVDNSDKVLTPSGTVYQTTDRHLAFDKQMVDDMLKKRSTIKKKMLDYREKGKLDQAKLMDYQQSLVKINTNSIIGAHGSEFNGMYDKENFGAITSLSRHSIMLAYTFTERFLEANFYFPNIEHVYNFLITTRRHCPPAEEINQLLDKYRLLRPFPDEVLEFLEANMLNYMETVPRRELSQYLEHIPLHELAFIYYNRNLKHLFQKNETVFRPWIEDFMSPNGVDWSLDVDPFELYKVDGDLVQVVATVYNHLIEGQPIYDTPKTRPEIARNIVRVARHMQQKLRGIDDLFQTFMCSDTFIGQVEQQKHMIRRTVIISDTDSVIFTSKNWCTWYLGGKFEFKPETYQIHSLIVYFLTKSIATLIKTMSRHRGAVGENINRMNIKNEYLYPVMMRCMQCKHYAGRITIQEGRVLPKPKMDIKGVNFRSSTLPKITLDFVQTFLISILDEIEKHTDLYVGDYIRRALTYEKTILDSLQKGALTYCGTVSIKYKEEYKNPDSSIYSNYRMWEEVFAPKYGSIHIPTKVPLISLLPNGLRNKRYLEWLSRHDHDVYLRLIKYLDHFPSKRKITRIPIAATLADIPPELIPVINLRDITYRNMAPIQLAMKSLGVDLGNDKKRRLLFIDHYSADFDNPLRAVA